MKQYIVAAKILQDFYKIDLFNAVCLLGSIHDLTPVETKDIYDTILDGSDKTVIIPLKKGS